MANPNPEIWGAQNTWIDDQILYTSGYTGTTELKNTKPKTANFSPNYTIDYRSGCLNRGIRLANVFQWGTPIDNTICPCGQDPTVSAYGRIDVYHNKKNIDQNKIPDYQNVYENENINWFFSSIVNYNQQLRYNKININSNVEQWAPNGVPDESDVYNNNAYIVPWTYYQVKSLLLQIMVLPINGQYAQNTTETNGAITLDEWKNNQSDKKISGVFLKIFGCGEYNSQNNIIAYTDTLQGGYSEGRSIGFSLMNAVNNGTSEITDYATFNYNKQNFIPLVSRYVRGNGFSSTEWCYIFGYHNLDNCELKYYYSEYAEGGYGIYPEIGYSDNNYEQIMKMAACFGVPFTPTDKNLFNILFNDSDLYLPIIDENGVTHGEYTNGNDNLTNDLYTKDSIREYDYDPTKPPKPIDTNTYSNTSHFYNVNVGGGNKRYSLSGFLGVDSLMSDLWALTTTLSADDFSNFSNKIRADMLVSDPIDSIVSLMCFPFIIPHNEESEPIKLGKYSLQTQGHAVTAGSYTINFNGVRLFPRFGGCYLDYEPYTNYEVYVPFCGTIPLRAADILGHTLNIKLVVDLYTGSCTGFVLADDLVIETIVGTIAITIPVTGIDSATINSQIVNANLNYKSALYSSSTAIGSTLSMGGFFSALTNPADTVNKIAQTQIAEDKAKYDLTHIPTQPHMIGSSSPVIGWCCDTIARVLIYYPTGDVINDSKPPSLIADKIAEFGKMQGFATVDTGKVSEYHGFTMGTLRTEGIACTESERQRLKALFATGVILP